jgi:hypothetical protein
MFIISVEYIILLKATVSNILFYVDLGCWLFSCNVEDETRERQKFSEDVSFLSKYIIIDELRDSYHKNSLTSYHKNSILRVTVPPSCI